MLKKKFSNYFLLYFNFIIYSLSSLFLKLASGYAFGSINYFVYYLCAVIALFIYAILWQQVLKYFSLSFAYGNRAIVIPIGMFWSYVVFSEIITPTMILGAVVILVGVILIAGDTNE